MRLVGNDRNNAMEKLEERWLNEWIIPYSHLITAQVMNWMPVSIDGRCHTFQCPPPRHCSAFRLLQCCGSEVNRFRNTLRLPKFCWSDLTALFKRHIVRSQMCCRGSFSGLYLQFEMGSAAFVFVTYQREKNKTTTKDFGLVHTILPPCGISGWWVTGPWTLGVAKWHEVNLTRSSSTWNQSD